MDMHADAYIEQIVAMRPKLVSMARKRLRNEVWAEDAVSETILAALERPGSFVGRSQLQTWLVGILKHKLVDQVRRHDMASCDVFDDEREEWGSTARDGMHASIEWRGPEACLHERQVLRQFDHCLQALPAQQARAFVLRDCMELDTDEVCEELGVTASNLFVMLSRARRRLREAFEPMACAA